MNIINIMRQREYRQRTKYKVFDFSGPIKSEEGIALAINLMLAAVMLVVMVGLIYLITSGTKGSGMQKRYRTAQEAAVAGADITTMYIGWRGTQVGDLTITPTINDPIGCTGTNLSGTGFTGWAAKLNTPSSNWSSGCNSQTAINPNDTNSYDIKFTLGGSPYPVYTVYTKIVNTIEGNTGGDEGLLGKGVVSSGEIQVMQKSFFYTIEADAESPANPAERAKMQILYQY
jgi:hypothetical protein